VLVQISQQPKAKSQQPNKKHFANPTKTPIFVPDIMTYNDYYPWTSGCFVLFSEYKIKNNNVFVKHENSEYTSLYFNLQLGAETLHNKKGSKKRPGAEFEDNFHKTLIIVSRQ
jgi:hypothetical protein